MSTEEQKARARHWFESLRDKLVAALEAIEDEYAGGASSHRFERISWTREGGGGGVIGLLRGQVFEKAGVNVSTVYGELTPEFRAQIPGAEKDRASGRAVFPW
jgi:coproporphyrinogen III oxidase